jgi:hypothetical protein
MIFMDETMNEKMNELYYECCQQMLFFWKIEQKNRVETIYVSFFQHKSTNEMLKS